MSLKNHMKFKTEISNSYSFTCKNFSSVLNQYKYQLSIGDITAGTTFSKENQGFLVDIGEAIAGYLPKDEISISKHEITQPIINDTREFFITAYNKKSKQWILSIKRLEYIRAWQRIKQIKEEDLIINLYIHKINKGGLVTTIEGIQGFIPNSHLIETEIKESLVNKKIKCQFLFIDEKSNTIIFSQKRAMLKSLLSTIHVGKITTGIIAKIKSYGVFINIYGFLALLHKSEIGNSNLNDTKLFHIGNSISVQVIHIDTQQGRLSVSRRYAFSHRQP